VETVSGMLASQEESGVRFLSNDEEIIRVTVVDDQRLFTKGLSGLVDMLPGVEVVGVVFDGEEAVALCREEEPDVVLMDISMPKMDGISATREIRDLLPQTAVIILTGHEDDEHVFDGIKAGAQGYLLKDSEPEDLSRAIRTVHAGNTARATTTLMRGLCPFRMSSSRSSWRYPRWPCRVRAASLRLLGSSRRGATPSSGFCANPIG
jgi:DNA-binding NarL/FixJ family response regulator